MSSNPQDFDLFIIGGGINGCGIARDAAGRGLRVGLAEMGDLAQATSSASTKLFHGGLRYLEFFEVRLVREALREREVLLQAMPHISWPMRFVLPYHGDMRFDAETPASRLLSVLMPWMKGRRPAWMIRAGLFMYDTLGGRKILPKTRSINLGVDPVGDPLKGQFKKAFEYSDCWVDDARLVTLNAVDAVKRGARVWTQTKVVAAVRDKGAWRITLQDAQGAREVRAKVLVNASGPWVGDVIDDVLPINTGEGVRLVRGSHIVVKRMFAHEKCYFLQGEDGRIVFAIPYEGEFTLIGTTDAEHGTADDAAICTEDERDYLIEFANRYFNQQLVAEDVVWTYSGVRPLYDDGAKSATAATREYVLSLEAQGAPVLNVFGGKITTYRKLAEAAMAKISGYFERCGSDWTEGVPLPGGDFVHDGFEALVASHHARYPFLGADQVKRLTRSYGTEVVAMLGHAQKIDDLGAAFGAGVTACELDWAISREFVRCSDDFIWRRSKLGLRLDAAQIDAIEAYIQSRLG